MFCGIGGFPRFPATSLLLCDFFFPVDCNLSLIICMEMAVLPASLLPLSLRPWGSQSSNYGLWYYQMMLLFQKAAVDYNVPLTSSAAVGLLLP